MIICRDISNDKKHFAITFDDGFSSWTETLKLFEKFNVKDILPKHHTVYEWRQREIFKRHKVWRRWFDYKWKRSAKINYPKSWNRRTYSLSQTLSKISLGNLKSEIEQNLRILNKFNTKVRILLLYEWDDS